ncbi:MAG: ATP-binding protein, partial [Lachnospiraceae bacterium]|nr:ATP-binding protein [Lachnospiraceae bacterium]
KNYRSFRDETILSMEATGLRTFRNSLISCNSMNLLPGVAIYGKNGGGKSNVIRAFWLAVQFIKNAQRTQHENAKIPVIPFALNDYSRKEPTEFEFIYTLEGIKYWYSFAATKEKICKEYLYYAPKGQKALVFRRENQTFHFTEDKAKRKLISKTVAPNQLFFSMACTMNDAVCVNAMKWFREFLYFSRDYSDIPRQLLDYSNDANMLQAISDYAKAADVGIESMQFEIDSKEIKDDLSFPESIPEGIKVALTQFMHILSETSDNSETRLKMNEIKAISGHQGVNANGEIELYLLELPDESDGTRKLMSIAPAIESALDKGGVLIIDEIEKELHPMLVDYIVAKFQSKQSNPNGAQLIFTTHNTELMNMELLRKDQLYFADKNKNDGASELYSISEFGTRTTENVRKGYLLGKYGATPDIEIEVVE